MRKSVWLPLLILALMLGSCGPVVQPAAGPETPSGEMFMVALPRLVIDFDAAGEPYIGTIKLANVANLIGQDASQLRMDPFILQWMATANVQHLEVRQTGNGVDLAVNGKQMPAIGWSDASLQKATDLVGALLLQKTDVITKLLPVARRVGLDVALRFPRPAGVAEIPLASGATATRVAATSITDPAAIVRFEVTFNREGVPGVLGISPEDLQGTGLDLSSVTLNRGVTQMLQNKNIQFVELRTKPDGLYLYVNGDPLPNIVWSDLYLANAVDLYVQMNPQSPYIELVRQVAPLVNKADIAVMVHFPLAAGAQPVAVKMH